jgi:hypothetical protein
MRNLDARPPLRHSSLGLDRTFTVFAAVLVIAVGSVTLLAHLTQTPHAPLVAPQDAEESSLVRIAQHPFDYVSYLEFAETEATRPPKAAQVRQAIEVAKSLAPTEALVARAEFRSAHARGDEARSLEAAWRLLELSPNDAGDALEALTAFSGTATWASFVSKRLDQGWQSAEKLLHFMCDRGIDENRLLFLAHRIARHRAIEREALHCVENKLVRAGSVDTAYHLHLTAQRALVNRLSFVANGEFERAPSGSPFDWTITPGGQFREGFDAQFSTNPSQQRPGAKLSVRFNGRKIEKPVITQYLALLPGKHRLTTVVSESGFGASEAPQWKLRCIGSGAPPIEPVWTESKIDARWARKQAEFSIPKECAGQLLSLEVLSRLKALEGSRGVVSIDEVRIERV